MKEDISKIIGIFIMGESMAGINSVITRTAECNLDTGELFWDRHRKYFVNLPKFKLDGSDITIKDLWLYSFKNLGNMENIDPSVYEKADEGLLKLIERAKVGALSKKEYAMYEASLKRLADEIDTEEHGFERGMEAGIEEGKHNESIRIATSMKNDGVDPITIAKWTNLTLEEIEKL